MCVLPPIQTYTCVYIHTLSCSESAKSSALHHMMFLFRSIYTYTLSYPEINMWIGIPNQTYVCNYIHTLSCCESPKSSALRRIIFHSSSTSRFLSTYIYIYIYIYIYKYKNKYNDKHTRTRDLPGVV